MSALTDTPDLARKAAAVNPVAAGHRNITAVISRERAGSIAVCRQGDTIALHLSTLNGTRVVIVSEREFTTKARGPRDHNGNPFRTLVDVVGPITAEELNAAPPPRISYPGVAMPESQRAAFQAALTGFLSGQFRSKRAALRAQPDLRANLYSAFVAWTARPAQRAFAAGYRRPVLKPSGGL